MISTTNIPSGTSGVSKTISPGNQIVTIQNIQLGTVPYKAGAYHIILNVVGPDMGSDFEGFYKDKDNPSAGRYNGQVGQIKMSDWPYSDGMTKSGIEIKRDVEMLKALSSLCAALDCANWLSEQDNKHNTIEELFDQFNSDKPYAGVEVRVCVGGKEYLNKAGYTNYELYVPKPTKGFVSIENTRIDSEKSRIMRYDAGLHIKTRKAAEPVSSFGETGTQSDSDFEL
jgi:hypothetical protein